MMIVRCFFSVIFIEKCRNSFQKFMSKCNLKTENYHTPPAGKTFRLPLFVGFILEGGMGNSTLNA